MRTRRLGCLTLCLLAVTSCGSLGLRDSPPTKTLDLDDPACDGTRQGRACLTMRFDLADHVRDAAEGDMAGRFEWGLYHNGHVGLLGPGDHVKVYGTPEPPPSPESLPLVDFTEGAYVLTLPDFPADRYQFVAYLDDDDSGEADDGDPCTFPKEGFELSANQHTQVDAWLDFIR